MSAGKRNVLFRPLRRLVAEPQFDRIQVELLGELVHRAFQRQKTDRLAGARIEEATGISRGASRCRSAVGAGIEPPRLARGALIGFLAPHIARNHSVPDRDQPAISSVPSRMRCMVSVRWVVTWNTCWRVSAA